MKNILLAILLCACGSLVAAESRVVRVPLEISNPGFEEGRKDWSIPKNGMLEVEEGHGNVVRLDVGDPIKDGIYVTRQIPVSAGAWYEASVEVRTEDVMPVDGRLPSVGAGLIVEWADENHKWIAAGDYACNRYITSDWATQSIKSLRAPDGAHYACIFLALRGTGTAWFDNLKMVHLDQEIEKCSPEADAEVATNVPLFQWKMIAGVGRYILELSQSPDFSDENMRSYDLSAVSQYRVSEPLGKGEWYWRVRAMGLPDSHPWKFTQAVDVTQDCLPPEISASAKRILSSEAGEYLFQVKDNTDENPVVTVTDDGNRRYRVEKMAGVGEYRVLPEDKWADGLITLVITARDMDGNSASQNAWILNAPKPEKVIAIDEQGRYVENGKVIFPLGIYQVDVEDMEEVRESGFEVVHSYKWEGSQDEVQCSQYLDACAQHGLRAFIGFDRGTHSGKGMVQGNFACIANRVGAQASNSGLFCWYLYDEPEIAHQYISPELMTQYAELIRQLDPYHPVVLTTWGSSMNNYRATWDTHWTQAYRNPGEVADQIEEHRRNLNFDSPITLLIHCYDRKQSKDMKAGTPVDFKKFDPGYDVQRCNAFVGFAKDVNGLFWWWYAKRDKNFVTAAQNPETWSEMKRVIQEVREYRTVQEADGMVSQGQLEYPVEGKNPEIVLWWVKRMWDGKYAGLLVNTSASEKTGSIQLPGFGTVEFALPRYGVKKL